MAKEVTAETFHERYPKGGLWPTSKNGQTPSPMDKGFTYDPEVSGTFAKGELVYLDNVGDTGSVKAVDNLSFFNSNSSRILGVVAYIEYDNGKRSLKASPKFGKGKVYVYPANQYTFAATSRFPTDNPPAAYVGNTQFGSPVAAVAASGNQSSRRIGETLYANGPHTFKNIPGAPDNISPGGMRLLARVDTGSSEAGAQWLIRILDSIVSEPR